MPYTVSKHGVIPYAAEALREFHVYAYEWIDNLHFIRPPGEFLPLPGEQVERYLHIARERFTAAGWNGEGEIGLLWLPPFVLPLELRIHPTGEILWHTKQDDDGISWLLSPIELPFEGFAH